jgi:hypothetical protein
LTLNCTSCEAPIDGPPVFDDGRPFCCRGCAAGGPCLCDYGHREASTPSGVPEPAHAPASSDAAAPPPALLRVSGFDDQRELLAFGLALEERPEVEALSLVRARLDDCWFAVAIADPPTLARVVRELPGFDVVAEPQDAGVEAALHARARPTLDAAPGARMPMRAHREPRAAEPAAAGRDAADAPLVLPSRPRFRLPSAEAVPAAPSAPPLESTPAVEHDEAGAVTVAPTPSEPPTMVAAADRPGGAAPIREHLTLVASPFRSFVTLSEFQDAVRALPGVTELRVRRFYRGTLQLAVDYDDVLPFTTRLRELPGCAWTLVAESPDLIELALGAEPAEAEAPTDA